jgi:hypothetical protein
LGYRWILAPFYGRETIDEPGCAPVDDFLAAGESAIFRESFEFGGSHAISATAVTMFKNALFA